MIVVDTSVIVAISKAEPDASAFVELLRQRDDIRLPASCYLEAVMVLNRLADGRSRLDALLERYGITILGQDARQARLAADAFERYGRGIGHPARLNFGDCLAYAAAAAHAAPLLFKGEDFARTDLVRALDR